MPTLKTENGCPRLKETEYHHKPQTQFLSQKKRMYYLHTKQNAEEEDNMT